MKYASISNILPLFALLVVGCSSPTALRTSENDDVYFASSDRVERTVELTPAPVVTRMESTEMTYDTNADEALNPEYSEADANADTYVTNNYYSETFASSNIRPRYHMPFNRFPSYNMMAMDPFFNPYHPFARRSFIDPYWGRSAMMYDPFYAYDPFYTYDPFMMYDPFFMGSRFNINLNFGFGYGYGMYSPWGYSPWGYGGLNSYYHGYNRGYQQGLYRQYYANNDSFRGQQTHYAPRGDRSISPGGNRIGRPDLNSGRVGPEGRTRVNNAVDVDNTAGRGRYEAVEGGRPARAGVEGTSPRGERPALTDRPVRSDDRISQPQDGRINRPGRTAERSSEYRPQRPISDGQEVAPARQPQRVERTYSRPARESAPVQRDYNRDNNNYNRSRSSESYSRPSESYSRPSVSPSSPSSSPSMGSPSGGGRPRR